VKPATKTPPAIATITNTTGNRAFAGAKSHAPAPRRSNPPWKRAEGRAERRDGQGGEFRRAQPPASAAPAVPAAAGGCTRSGA